MNSTWIPDRKFLLILQAKGRRIAMGSFPKFTWMGRRQTLLSKKSSNFPHLVMLAIDTTLYTASVFVA